MLKIFFKPIINLVRKNGIARKRGSAIKPKIVNIIQTAIYKYSLRDSGF